MSNSTPSLKARLIVAVIAGIAGGALIVFATHWIGMFIRDMDLL